MYSVGLLFDLSTVLLFWCACEYVSVHGKHTWSFTVFVETCEIRCAVSVLCVCVCVCVCMYCEMGTVWFLVVTLIFVAIFGVISV